MKKYKLIIPIILITVPAFACRPLTTDDACTVQTGKYELELGYDNYTLETNQSTNFSIKHGLTDRMDMGISFSYQILPEQNERFGPATLGIKINLIKELIAITFSNIIGSSNYSLNTIFSNKIGPLNFHVNIGYNATGKGEEQGNMFYAIGIEYPLEKIDMFFEVFENVGRFWLTGARYNLDIIDCNLFFDIGYSRSFIENIERTTLGIHYEF